MLSAFLVSVKWTRSAKKWCIMFSSVSAHLQQNPHSLPHSGKVMQGVQANCSTPHCCRGINSLTWWTLFTCSYVIVIPANNPEWLLKIILNWSSASKNDLGKHKVYTHTRFVLHVSVCGHAWVCKIILPNLHPQSCTALTWWCCGAQNLSGSCGKSWRSWAAASRRLSLFWKQPTWPVSPTQKQPQQHDQSAQHKNNHNNMTSQPNTKTTWHYSYSKLAAFKQDY